MALIGIGGEVEAVDRRRSLVASVAGALAGSVEVSVARRSPVASRSAAGGVMSLSTASSSRRRPGRRTEAARTSR